MSSNLEPAPGAAGETPYDILGLSAGASEAEIEEAYGELSAMFAPGAVAESRQSWARKQRGRLAGAYSELIDPERKRQLDARLGVSAPATPSVTPDVIETYRAEEPAIAPEAAVIEEIAPTGDDAPVLDAEFADDVAPVAASDSVATEMVADGEAPYYSLDQDTPDAATSEQTAPEALEPQVSFPDPDQSTRPLSAGMTTVVAPASSSATLEPEPDEPLDDYDEAEDEELSVTNLEEDEPAPWQPQQPARFTPTPRQKVATPLQTTRGVDRGVALPSRREAAQITAQAAARALAEAEAAAAPPARRPAQPGVVRRTPPPPPVRRTTDLEEQATPRVRRTPAPQQVATAARPKRKKQNGLLAYQILSGVIVLLLILSTFTAIVGTATTTSPTSAAATPVVSSLLAAGDSAFAGGDPNGALSYYQQAAQYEPRNQRALLALARYYASINPPVPELARQYITQVVNIDTSTTEAAQALSLLSELGADSTPVVPVMPAATTASDATAAAPLVPEMPTTAVGASPTPPSIASPTISAAGTVAP